MNNDSYHFKIEYQLIKTGVEFDWYNKYLHIQLFKNVKLWLHQFQLLQLPHLKQKWKETVYLNVIHYSNFN